jgi:5-methylcytosine-specific restriction endonuclease McrA
MIPRKPIRSRRRKPGPGRLKGEALEALRRACFERDGYQCQQVLREEPMPGFEADLVSVFRCWKRVTWESGHMAHIVSRGRGGKDELSNVKTKCAECHIGIEHSYGPSGRKPVPPSLL